MNPFDPRCHDFKLFLNLTYWNIGQWSDLRPSRRSSLIADASCSLACNIFTDVCLGAFPVPIIWTLKMRLRVRLYVVGILNLGYSWVK